MTVEHDTENRVFSEALRRWNISFGGISASELADALQVPHQDVMRLIEKWVSDGQGTMNENVELSIIELPEPGSGLKFSFTRIKTHIFFPGREELTEHFYSGGGARSNPSEFKRRLMCGAHQLALCFFFRRGTGEVFRPLGLVPGGRLLCWRPYLDEICRSR